MIDVIRDAFRVYDLEKLREREVGFMVGRATFRLMGHYGELPGVVVMEDIPRNTYSFSDLDMPEAEYYDDLTRYFLPSIPPHWPGTILQEGEGLRVGRKDGVEIRRIQHSSDEELDRDHAMWAPLEHALRIDNTLDESHAEITAVGQRKVRVEDLGTQGGTRVFIK